MYLLLLSLGKLDEAEPLYRKAVEIGETVLGPDHPDLATWLNNLVNTCSAGYEENASDTRASLLCYFVSACHLRTMSHRRCFVGGGKDVPRWCGIPWESHIGVRSTRIPTWCWGVVGWRLGDHVSVAQALRGRCSAALSALLWGGITPVASSSVLLRRVFMPPLSLFDGTFCRLRS